MHNRINSEINSSAGKIKRRNFFLYLGVSLAGIFSLSRMPFKLFHSKIDREIRNTKKIRIEENPYAVKRVSKEMNNG